MSLKVLSPKPLPTVQVTVGGTSIPTSRNMKDLRGTQMVSQQTALIEGPVASTRSSTPAGGRRDRDRRRESGGTSQRHYQQQHQPPRPAPSPMSPASPSHRNHMDVSQNFDTDHIIYNAASDITYLRGRLLGKGGFARCYELLSLSDNKIYAGKIISKSRITKPHHRQKIAHEVELQMNLKHRNVVEFHSFFEDDSNVYIILENCSRKSLIHVMKHRQYLTEPEVRYYMQQLVEGVQYVHNHHIIHRDLKLGNMLLNDNMDLKLADFGLASRVQYEGEKKMTVCGTPNYIAPEVLQKKGHSYEADIWAVGCTMYAMLVGRPPFETNSLTETYRRITRNSYKIPSFVSAPAASLIHKCLRSNPQQRIALQEIRADDFFTSGYMPRSLSPSCCTSAPQFPDHVLSQNGEKTMLVCESPRPDPTNNLGNALSRMQLNSCSENIFEEKELEAIEKQSPQQTPTSKVCGPIPQVVTKEVPPNRDNEQCHSLPQKEVSPKPKPAATLLEALSACLECMPKDAAHNPPALSENGTVWVTKWVDYSNKYGFGFMLSNDTMGVLFNDTSRILLHSDGRSVHYNDMTGKLSAYTMDSVPEEVSRKTTLLQYFARYMDEHLIQGGDLESSHHSDLVCSSSLYLKKWFRITTAIVLYLSDGTLQVNFFEDHAKLILSHVRGEYIVTFIDPDRCAKAYNMALMAQNGCHPSIRNRLAFARSRLQNLVDIEGADV